MKKSVPHIFMFICCLIFAQNNNVGMITYRKEILLSISETEKGNLFFKNHPQITTKIKEIEKKGNEMLKNIEFNLLFSNNESLFKVQKTLENENNRFYKFALGPNGSAIYYNNSKDKLSLKQLEAYGETFLIKEKPIEWQTTVHTKKINNYTCYKAIATKTVKGRRGDINYPITAWFCPEISIQFGPLGFSGLPGLILELEVYNERYTAVKIELDSKKKVKIEKPKKGKEVTKEEFEEIGLKTMSEFKKTLD